MIDNIINDFENTWQRVGVSDKPVDVLWTEYLETLAVYNSAYARWFGAAKKAAGKLPWEEWRPNNEQS